MKIIYDILSGLVISLSSEDSPTVIENQAIIDVPEQIIAQSITRVLSNGNFETDPFIIERQWASIREYRSKLLRDSDWICSITDYIVPEKENWIIYRQSLRDITSQPNPFTIQWPKSPYDTV